MKTKFISVYLLTFLIFAMLLVVDVQASQSAEFLIRNYSIDLTVDDLETAIRHLDEAPVMVVVSSINEFRPGTGHMTLRVNNQNAEYVLWVLHNLGDVTHSRVFARNVFATVSDLNMQRDVRNTEHERLMELLIEVETLDEFTAVENRLVQVISNLEWINGRINNYDFETNTTTINLFLTASGDQVEIYPIGAFGRIGNAFVDSAGFSLSMLQWGMLVLAYVSVPLVTVLLIGGGITWWAVKRKNKVGKVVKMRKDGNTDKVEVQNEEGK